MEFPFLSIIVFAPIITAVIILLLPKERKENARMLALAYHVEDLVGAQISDGGGTDTLSAYAGGSSVIPAGGRAVIIDSGDGTLGSRSDVIPRL